MWGAFITIAVESLFLDTKRPLKWGPSRRSEAEPGLSAQHRRRRAERQPLSGVRWEAQEVVWGEAGWGACTEAVARAEAVAWTLESQQWVDLRQILESLPELQGHSAGCLQPGGGVVLDWCYLRAAWEAFDDAQRKVRRLWRSGVRVGDQLLQQRLSCQWAVWSGEGASSFWARGSSFVWEPHLLSEIVGGSSLIKDCSQILGAVNLSKELIVNSSVKCWWLKCALLLGYLHFRWYS